LAHSWTFYSRHFCCTRSAWFLLAAFGAVQGRGALRSLLCKLKIFPSLTKFPQVVLPSPQRGASLLTSGIASCHSGTWAGSPVQIQWLHSVSIFELPGLKVSLIGGELAYFISIVFRCSANAHKIHMSMLKDYHKPFKEKKKIIPRHRSEHSNVGYRF
jgi:hypothetical protein